MNTDSIECSVLSSTATIMPFDPSENVDVRQWFLFFERRTQDKSDDWRKDNIFQFLKGLAFSYYINNCQQLSSYDDVKSQVIVNFSKVDCSNVAELFNLQLKDVDNIYSYFSKKNTLAKKFNIADDVLIEGLNQGLPRELQNLIISSRVKSPAEWLDVAIKLKLPSQSNEFTPRKTQPAPEYHHRQWERSPTPRFGSRRMYPMHYQPRSYYRPQIRAPDTWRDNERFQRGATQVKRETTHHCRCKQETDEQRE